MKSSNEWIIIIIIIVSIISMMIINLQNYWLCCYGWSQNKTERMWKERQVPRPCSGIEKKLWNMKVTIVPMVIAAFGTVIKWLIKGPEDLEVGGRVETIQTIALLRTARLMTSVLETWGDLQSVRLQWKTIS